MALLCMGWRAGVQDRKLEKPSIIYCMVFSVVALSASTCLLRVVIFAEVFPNWGATVSLIFRVDKGLLASKNWGWGQTGPKIVHRCVLLCRRDSSAVLGV